MFYDDMIEATKVVFLKPIFEDDFPERGMKAWLTKIERTPGLDDELTGERAYKLYFDFTDFEKENDKYFTECYYPNTHTKKLPDKQLYTAKEAGCERRCDWIRRIDPHPRLFH